MTSRGAGYSVTIRAEYPNRVGMLGQIASTIGEVGGDIGAIDIVRLGRDRIIRDLTITVYDGRQAEDVVGRLRAMSGVEVLNVSDHILLLHQGGKIRVTSRIPVRDRATLSEVYTPGVAHASQAIFREPEAVWKLTVKSNSVAIVTDGTAVLGLGDIGPAAAMPVMEGKAMLFRDFADVDAWPLCLNTRDPGEIVLTVKAISPGFGGINLEDISAPRCFEIEERLKQELDIPVFHDDQHGTAVVVFAALLNAVKLVNKEMADLKVVISGAGAAGSTCARFLSRAGVKDVIVCDRSGAIYVGRQENMNPAKERLARDTNRSGFKGLLSRALEGADFFLGVSAPGLVKGEDLKAMNRDPIVFALANPLPEIPHEEAQLYARIVATGRSDYPNQVNNALAFPGIFRGALDVRAREINLDMQMAASRAIASVVGHDELSPEYIVPSIFNQAVVRNVSQEVARAAQRTGVARKMV